MKFHVVVALVASLILACHIDTCMAANSEGFSVSEIDAPTFERMKGKSYKDDCPIPLTDLRYLHVLHKDIDGVTHEGELICNVRIADDVLEIFKALYEAGYPIERVSLVDDYGADDETSMRDNNSSCFNFRFISHTTKISKHGLGLAVDINTLYNPYVKEVDGKRIVEPATADEYTDRSKDFRYKIEKGDLCYKLFTERGFEWGGEWKTVKDYQHFEVSDEVARELYPDYR
ncbi:MAG: M15 family metallopeptidase [Synergistaceae bacterium]|nr:M15 family metallopeptidase [Synergistaceae bacterium]